MELYLNNNYLCDNIRIADSFFSRFKGLMFQKDLGEYNGLLLKQCQSIHMFFMKFPIDAVFVDKNDTIIYIYEHLRPWRISGYHYTAAHVFEFSAGFVEKHKIQKADTLSVR